MFDDFKIKILNEILNGVKLISNKLVLVVTITFLAYFFYLMYNDLKDERKENLNSNKILFKELLNEKKEHEFKLYENSDKFIRALDKNTEAIENLTEYIKNKENIKR